MLVFWEDHVQIHNIIKSDFCIEMEVECDNLTGKVWVVFVYLSTDDHIRKTQWECLKQKRFGWGRRWILGGDFNDIMCHEDKAGGRRRLDSSFTHFRTFIREMGMKDVTFRGRRWTWANNRQE